jgi:hypothetical protein
VARLTANVKERDVAVGLAEIRGKELAEARAEAERACADRNAASAAAAAAQAAQAAAKARQVDLEASVSLLQRQVCAPADSARSCCTVRVSNLMQAEPVESSEKALKSTLFMLCEPIGSNATSTGFGACPWGASGSLQSHVLEQADLRHGTPWSHTVLMHVASLLQSCFFSVSHLRISLSCSEQLRVISAPSFQRLTCK